MKYFLHSLMVPVYVHVHVHVHVQDLCAAHALALQSLMQGAGSQAYNLGNNRGFSVQEVLDTARYVTGRKILTVDAPRRVGDPACLVADSRQARANLGWQPQLNELATIIEHAWNWEKKMSGVGAASLVWPAKLTSNQTKPNQTKPKR